MPDPTHTARRHHTVGAMQRLLHLRQLADPEAADLIEAAIRALLGPTVGATAFEAAHQLAAEAGIPVPARRSREAAGHDLASHIGEAIQVMHGATTWIAQARDAAQSCLSALGDGIDAASRLRLLASGSASSTALVEYRPALGDGHGPYWADGQPMDESAALRTGYPWSHAAHVHALATQSKGPRP